MTDRSAPASLAENRLILILGSIARGHNGNPITGKDAQIRARNTLEELGIDWRANKATLPSTDSTMSDGAIYAAISQRDMTQEEHDLMMAAVRDSGRLVEELPVSQTDSTEIGDVDKWEANRAKVAKTERGQS